MSDRIPALPKLRPLPATENPVVEEWLGKAVADLETAAREAAVSGSANYDAVCFHAQQAVEKLLKAVLIARGITPPFTHDLTVLATLATKHAGTWEYDSKDLRLLTLGAVPYRYPGLAAAQQDAVDALAIACRMWPSLVALLPAA